MRNTWLVVKHEIVVTLRKPSFWILAFVFPVLIVALDLGIPLLVTRSIASEQAQISGGANGNTPTAIGYVDQAGLIKQIPASLPEGYLLAFPDQAAAQKRLEADAGSQIDPSAAAGRLPAQEPPIKEYVVISPDYLQTGKLLVVQRNFQPLGDTPEDLFRYVIDYNLVGDPELSAALADPIQSTSLQAVAPDSRAAQDNFFASLVPTAVLFILFFLLVMGGGYVLQSVAREKENRTAEVLLLSLRPRELMLGKILGLSLVALFQMAVWSGGGLLLLSHSRTFSGGAASFTLPPGFFFWTLAFFLLGYLLYSSLLGAIGAAGPNARENGQFTFMVLFPLMLPIWFNLVFSQSPNGPLVLALSLFPLTAPTSMVARLAVGSVPLWQLVASLVGLAAAAYFFVLLSARFFSADTLLSTSALNWRRILGVLRS